MKKILFLLLANAIVVYSQNFHPIPVSSSSGVSYANACAVFQSYHALASSGSAWNAIHDHTYLSNHFSGTWYSPMRIWDESGTDAIPGTAGTDAGQTNAYTRAEAGILLGYIHAYNGETDATRKANYLTIIQGLSEYLLALQNTTVGSPWYGGVFGVPQLGISSRADYLHPTAFAGVAFCEAYEILHDQRLRDAAIRTAEYYLNNPSYPYPDVNRFSRTACTSDAEGGDGQFYSNVNHMGMQLWNLASVYSLTGNHIYLDSSLVIAEEIMAWQNFRDASDTYWTDSDTDGGWYWYDYGAHTLTSPPLPHGIVGPPRGPGVSFAPERKMGYHHLTLQGLLKLLAVTGQQTLPGIVTARNHQTFWQFKSALNTSIRNAINFMIDNQETVDDGSRYQYRGALKNYKNGISTGGDPNPFTAAAFGFESVINAYNYLVPYGINTTTADATTLRNFIGGVSLGYYTARTGTGSNTPTGWCEGVLPGWGAYMEYVNKAPLTSRLSLKNKDFENDEIIWETWSWDGTGVSIVDGSGRGSSKCVRITDNSFEASKWASQIVTASAGNYYSLSGYAKILSGTQYLVLDFLNANYESIVQYRSSVSQASGFQATSVSNYAPSGTAFVRIWLYAGWYEASDGYWDDINISENGINLSRSPSFAAEAINFPNPFNPTTTIAYSVPHADNVTIKIFDMAGREIATLLNEFKNEGKYSISFDGSKLSSGTYLYALQIGNSSVIKKMQLIK